VLRIDAANLTITHRLQTKACVVAMARYGDELAVLDTAGGLWLADPHTLVLRIVLETAATDARAMVVDGPNLFVSVHQGQGENGSVLVFQPGTEAPPQ
jgi:hypothetical protein